MIKAIFERFNLSVVSVEAGGTPPGGIDTHPVIHSILYVSRSCLTYPQAERAVQDIVDWSVIWNASAGVTGALVFTERHFAQFIEGPRESVLDLLGKIKRDPRHTRVTVRRERTEPDRLFGDWSLAYVGPEVFLEPTIAPLVGALPDVEVERYAEDLLGLMRGFVAQRRH